MSKALTFLFIITFLFSTICRAQPEQDACNAILLCGNTFTTPTTYTGIGAVSDLTTTPCGAGEGNSMWLRLNINNGGTIVFTLSPINPNDDYDFAVLDMTNTTCDNLSSANVVRCNFNNNNPGSNVNGVVGLGPTGTLNFVLAGATGNSFCTPLNVNAGDVLLIMLNNFGDYVTNLPPQGFTIDFTGSTATFNGVNPKLVSVVPSCNSSQQLTVQMSTNVKCNSIAPNGSDFSISGGGVVASAGSANCTGPNSLTNTITINFASPLPSGWYTLSAQTGSDGNTVLDPCNNPLLLPDNLQVYIPEYVPPKFLALDATSCIEIPIKMNSRVRCDSIANNGSDFIITGPQPVNVIAAYGKGCDSLNFTDSIVVVLQSSMQTDGVYTITSTKGTDGNTQVDSCGLHQPVGDAITITINSWDGKIVAMPDQVICKPEYVLLTSTNNTVPPLTQVSNCEAVNTTCTGKISGAYVGSNKDSSTAANSPFYAGFHDSKSQYLFLASELRNAGLKGGSIRTLQWKVTQKSSAIPFDNFTIKIGCTPLNNLSGSLQGNLQTVYSTPSYNSVSGINSFDLTTPYNWDGISNLIVEVCFDNTAVSFHDQVAHSATTFNSVIHRYGNNLSGCAITSEGTLSTASSLRPKTRFFICDPPPGVPSYIWSPGNFVSDSTAEQPLAFIVRNTTFEVATIDKEGCPHRDSTMIRLSIRDPQLSPVPDTTVCFGKSVRLNASGGIHYAWMSVDTATLSCLNCASPIVTPKDTTVYEVVISDEFSCSDTLRTTVNINPLPIVVGSPEDTLVRYGSDIRLAANGAYIYTWSPIRIISDPYIPTPLAHITEPVIITLTGIDLNGCRNMDSIRIAVDYRFPVLIPSAFTPNGDGRNDVFRIAGITFHQLLEFKVFNRWGEEIFRTTDPRDGWDGTVKGQMQSSGVYQYLIRLAFPDGKVETYKGDVTLIL